MIDDDDGVDNLITYRKASISDVDELVRLRIEFLKEAQNIESEIYDSCLEESLRLYFNNTISNNTFIAWLALDDNKIVATSGLCFYNLPPSYKNFTGNVAYIMNIYTQSDYRNKGIATYLFEKMIEEAKNLGYRKLCLHATEKGRSLYLKYGFKNTDNEMVLNLE